MCDYKSLHVEKRLRAFPGTQAVRESGIALPQVGPWVRSSDREHWGQRRAGECLIQRGSAACLWSLEEAFPGRAASFTGQPCWASGGFQKTCLSRRFCGVSCGGSVARVISISHACNVLWKGKAHKGTDLGCHSFGSLAHVTPGLPENKLCRPYQEVALLPLGIPGGAERWSWQTCGVWPPV